MTAQGTKFCGLPFDNLEVGLLSQIEVATLFDLREFPFTDQVSRPANCPAGIGGIEAAGKMKRVREQVVAKQHAGLIVPAGVDRRDMAAGFGIIQDVIMHQRRKVNHLDDGCQNFVLVTNPAGRLRSQQ